ncbi:siderophore-interacting protein [Flavobacterium sp. MC2016-06]|jgi:NADPH-dependent ferric siderophore reductase|uniref:siderophore-interacting protein n=1 Tax=Flavobacterium sp. MC2016-06 TaxID=2676308 RepID=UPI0012BB0D64|nr:siderophore-interacting protein [Flavobacterium sp. MC2016-06]MBU3858902.1 siderophore-interacting protein [Flavobacterium sp. MC2016-06]
MSENNNNEKPVVMQAVLKVKTKTFLTPNYIRIILEGDDMAIFANARVGDNNKIIIPPNKEQEFTLADFTNRADGKRPLMRTYTMRDLDLEKGLMTIDFVAHGDTGPASKWANNAKAGDQLVVFMKVKTKPLFIPSDWYLLIGDHTALPVISVILESLPADAQGKAIIEVFSEADILKLKKPENIDLIWNFNTKPGEKSELADSFETTDFPSGSKFIYAAAEYQTAEKIQQKLRNDENLSRNQWQTYSYWKYGQAEDASSDVRREQSKK